jgi:L-threonylcarbamoyladenylate synthase
METIKLSLKDHSIDVVKDVLATGGVVVFPTSNTYGLLANGLDQTSVLQIFELKGRGRSKPLGYLSSPERAQLTGVFNDLSSRILNLWPGPLSLIVPKSQSVPHYVTTFDSILLVCPDEMSRKLVNSVDFPIVCTSANLSGHPAIVDYNAALATFDKKVPLIVDGGRSKHGANGTIVDFVRDVPTVLRVGPFPMEKLQEVMPNLVLADKLLPN